MRNSKGQFQKGNEPYNKGIQRGSVSPETEFQKGVHSMHFKGYGVPNVINRKGRRNEVIATTTEQIPRTSRGREYLTRKRTSYARYLWKKHIGEIPTGMVIYNVDQANPEVIKLKNLELITRGELLKINNERRLK